MFCNQSNINNSVEKHSVKLSKSVFLLVKTVMLSLLMILSFSQHTKEQERPKNKTQHLTSYSEAKKEKIDQWNKINITSSSSDQLIKKLQNELLDKQRETALKNLKNEKSNSRANREANKDNSSQKEEKNTKLIQSNEKNKTEIPTKKSELEDKTENKTLTLNNVISNDTNATPIVKEKPSKPLIKETNKAIKQNKSQSEAPANYKKKSNVIRNEVKHVQKVAKVISNDDDTSSQPKKPLYSPKAQNWQTPLERGWSWEYRGHGVKKLEKVIEKDEDEEKDEPFFSSGFMRHEGNFKAVPACGDNLDYDNYKSNPDGFCQKAVNKKNPASVTNCFPSQPVRKIFD